jgi:hypothetical protein
MDSEKGTVRRSLTLKDLKWLNCMDLGQEPRNSCLAGRSKGGGEFLAGRQTSIDHEFQEKQENAESNENRGKDGNLGGAGCVGRI